MYQKSIVFQFLSILKIEVFFLLSCVCSAPQHSNCLSLSSEAYCAITGENEYTAHIRLNHSTQIRTLSSAGIVNTWGKWADEEVLNAQTLSGGDSPRGNEECRKCSLNTRRSCEGSQTLAQVAQKGFWSPSLETFKAWLDMTITDAHMKLLPVNSNFFCFYVMQIEVFFSYFSP